MKLTKVLPYALLVALVAAYFAMNYDPLSAEVSGSVYWNKQVLRLNSGQRGTVQFRPVEGGANCIGKIDSSGAYVIGTGGRSALAPGDYHISVSVVEVVAADEEGALPKGVLISPPDYADPVSSGLTFLVKRGENTHDIHIEGEGALILPTDDFDLESDSSENSQVDDASEAKEQDVDSQELESSNDDPPADDKVLNEDDVIEKELTSELEKEVKP